MSASMYRRQLESKRRQRIDAERQASRHRKKEADKRGASTKGANAAAKTKNATTMRTRMSEAARREDEANKAGAEYARWQEKAAKYAEEEAKLEAKLAKAEQTEREAAERQRERERLAAGRRSAAQLARVGERIDVAESQVGEVLRQLRAPKPEQLRVLMLAASADGGLRVAREQARIRAAVERALHCDYVELDVRPSATTDDLLDGITRFRPHVVHFSGHGSDELVVFEENVDINPKDVIVSAETFAAAVSATDEPPLLVFLNSCRSGAQIGRLVERVAPFAIGMSDTIEDGDAIVYATQFYAAVASGQSVLSSHLSGQAALQLAGLPGHELPQLAHAPDVDPAATILVSPPTAQPPGQ